ncbi:MAG: glycine/betaine/sarcosine/D-proline family reductase selenoprotein B [Chloroflexi bacterium]|nr:glycine/betaine/sarcosine/D-proline family reductase selenoprotein B [Chloroflexota bacterium]
MIKVVHYINQFFAGIGGEDKAGAPFEVRSGAVGPGRALQMALGERATIVCTLVCGDNTFHERRDDVIEAALAAIKEAQADLLVAGPAFNAGRYGLACGAVCAAAKETLGLPVMTGLFPENPAVEVYRDRVVMVPTGQSAAGMKDALEAIARVGLKLADKERLRPASEEGTIPMGTRANWVIETPAADRAVSMLLAKLRGQPYQTEIVLPPQAERVKPAAPLADLTHATVALVTEGGLVPLDNPDRIESSSATRWARYPLTMLAENDGARFKSIHAGYDARWVNADPDRIVPLDAARALEAAGAFGKLHDYFYVTAGTGTSVANASAIGGAIAKQLIAEGVHAALVTST